MGSSITIREAMDGMKAGADINIFPGDFSEPKIIKALKGSLPQLKMMPIGGVDASTAEDWGFAPLSRHFQFYGYILPK